MRQFLRYYGDDTERQRIELYDHKNRYVYTPPAPNNEAGVLQWQTIVRNLCELIADQYFRDSGDPRMRVYDDGRLTGFDMSDRDYRHWKNLFETCSGGIGEFQDNTVWQRKKMYNVV